MPENKGKHLDIYDRSIVEEGLEAGLSAREIARRLKVNVTTVTREILANRTVRPPKRKDMSPSKRCANFTECQRSGDACRACRNPANRLTCRRCKAAKCFEECPDFELRMCERTQRWPYVCTCYTYDRDGCHLPKCRYSAHEADAAARLRRTTARGGIAISPAELEAVTAVVSPLVKKGQSLEAIWATHGSEFPIGVRTFYNYIEKGYVDIASLELPRKVRYRKRKSKVPSAPVKDRVDRTGRSYKDFMALPDEERASSVQMDTVVGYTGNKQRILSLHFSRAIFQIYMLIGSGDSSEVVAALDAIELYLGSPDEFRRIAGAILADRGKEFDDFEGIERSALAPGAQRCRVYYCDAMQPSQKANCECNHAELRKILPKRRSDFDALSAWDVAVICSHVNSYPRKSLGGATPYSLASQIIPSCLFEHLGIERVQPDEVVLRPNLIAHAVKQ